MAKIILITPHSSSNGSNPFVIGSGAGSKNVSGGSNSSSAMATPVSGGAALRNHAAEAQLNFG